MERNSTNRLRLGAATLLLGAAMGVSAQDANVKLGVVQVGNELQVQFMPDQNVNLPVTASQFTVNWNNPNVSLGTEEWMSEAVATYMQGFAVGTLYLGTRQDATNGGQRYATFTQESLGGNASWTANTPVSILRIPISNPGNECVVFSVVDDAYANANNLAFYMTLGAGPTFQRGCAGRHLRHSRSTGGEREQRPGLLHHPERH